MDLRRVIIVILIMTTMATIAIVPCYSQKKTDKDIWTEDDQRGPGGGPGRGGPGRGDRGPGRFRSREEEVNRFLEELKKSNPKRAEELGKLRKDNPEKFREEFVKTMREHWNKRIESWRSKWRAEFLQWLQKAVPKVAEKLARLKETDTDLYAKQYEIVREKYKRIFEESKRNPELAEVLLAEMELKERRELLLNKIKHTKGEKEKSKLIAQLKEVVGNEYDLIIRKKIIAYEFLLRRVEELQKELNKSREEIVKWQDSKIKKQNINERVGELLNEKSLRNFWR